MSDWENPYRCTKRAADTMMLIEEGRLQTRLVAREGAVAEVLGVAVERSDREWRSIGGPIGSWRDAAFHYASLFLEAGLVSVDVMPGGPSEWAEVRLTRAGWFLFQTWGDHPFFVMEAK